MTKTDWTAEEVQSEINRLRRGGVADAGVIRMLTAFAERIAADEKADCPKCHGTGEVSDSDGLYVGQCTACRAIKQPAQEQPGGKVPEGWARTEAKLHERKTVHEWLNDLHIEREEFGKSLCLLRRLRILCDRYADTCAQLSFEILKQAGWRATIPTQTVDVEAVREVINDMQEWLLPLDIGAWRTKLSQAIGG